MKKSLQKALDDLDFIHQDLREAGRNGTATDNLIILPLIKKAAELRIEINALYNAHLYDMEEQCR